MNRKPSRIPDVLYIVVNAFGTLFWMIAVLYAFLFGGSPGPDYERTVPMAYAGVMALGILGAALGVAAGIKGRAGGKAEKALPVSSAVLIAIATAPLFLTDLTEAGLIVLLPGVLPALLYLLATRKRGSSQT